jgi:hypothetical protein
MAAFRSGTTYTLMRKQSRNVEINAVVSWETVSRETGGLIEHCLFSMSLRQASRYGSATAPKLFQGGIYGIERPDGEAIPVRLYREKLGENGRRFIWMRRVVK